MPVLSSTFRPPFWLRSGHLQTLLAALLPRRLPDPFQRERLELPDGDFVDLHWARRGCGKLAILCHGLEGSATAQYNLGLAAALQQAGWDALAWSFRGCGTEPNRLPRAYHSGETGDLAEVLRRALAGYELAAVVGVSLGGNVVLKYLGEAPPHPKVRAGVAISAPIDLGASAAVLDGRPANWLYRRRFLAALNAKMARKAVQFPGQVAAGGRLRTFREFDGLFTAPLHGFRDADDYWARSSSRQFLGGLTVPTLLLNARNDPMLTPESFPFAEAETNPHLYFEAPESGGHAAFLDFRRGLAPWSEQRVVAFLQEFARP